MLDRLNQPLQTERGKRPGANAALCVRNLTTVASGVLISVIAMLSLVQPVSAATLGEMSINSARGEHLLAEIAVSNVAASEAASLSVSIADAEFSAAADLVQSDNLPFLWAELRQRNNEQADNGWYVQLLSSEPVSDPYNEIIVELEWDGGSYLREYALRFGGSTRVAEKPLPTINPATTTASSSAAAITSAPSATASPAGNTSADAAGANAASAQAATGNSGDAQSVRVNRGDNLLQIVRGLQLPSNVTPEQAMWGIYTANTRSFSGSPDRLLAGVELQIPAMQSLASIPQQTALAGLQKPVGNAQTALQAPAQSVATTPVATQATPTVSLRDPSIPLYQPDSSVGAAVTEDSATSLSLTRVVTTDSVSDVVSRQQSRSRVEQTLDQLNASLAEVRADISGVENSVSSLSSNVGSNVGKVKELSSLISELNLSQAQANTTSSNPASSIADIAAATAAVDTTTVAESAATQSSATATRAGSGSVSNNSGTTGVSYYVQRFMDSTYLRSLILLSIGLLLALFLVTRQLLAQRRQNRLLAQGTRGKTNLEKTATDDEAGTGKVYSAPALAGSAGAQSGPSVLRMQEEVVDAPTALSWFREHLRSGRVSELDLVKALRRYPNRQDLRLRLMERYANRQEVESFAQLAREMFHLTRGRNKEWPRAIQLGLALELEMQAMEPHLARPFEPVDFGVERDIESPYAGDSTLQFAEQPHRSDRTPAGLPRQRSSSKRRSSSQQRSVSQSMQPDVTLDKTLAI